MEVVELGIPLQKDQAHTVEFLQLIKFEFLVTDRVPIKI